MGHVRITARGAKRIRKGHLWVYRSDVRRADDIGRGEMARVADETGNFVGHAFYSDASEIALRFLTTREETIDREWWRARFHQGAARRAQTAPETNPQRIDYSERDLLPART